MATNSKLTRSDYEDFLIYLYFGSKQDFLKGCVKRAYLDFNRTMHGFSSFENGAEINNQAVKLLTDSFTILKSLASGSINMDLFDFWHQSTCEQIIALFNKHGFHFYVGQAQKWINMTLKYIYTVGEKRISGFESVYPFCHVPFDNILLEQLKKFGFPMLSCAWSRLDDYPVYLQKQNWIRQRFKTPPLDVEFSLWLGKGI